MITTNIQKQWLKCYNYSQSDKHNNLKKDVSNTLLHDQYNLSSRLWRLASSDGIVICSTFPMA